MYWFEIVTFCSSRPEAGLPVPQSSNNLSFCGMLVDISVHLHELCVFKPRQPGSQVRCLAFYQNLETL